jgi:orotidine-5'-phosphate decarboxylase
LSKALSFEPLIIALDYPTRELAEEFVQKISPTDCRIKVGKELFTRAGPAYVEELAARGFEIFLDLKFHDIPNTVAGAVAAAADLGVWMVNVHASGGRRMMEAAADKLATLTQPPLLIGVTVLTSMSADDLAETGVEADPARQVLRLARLALDAGLDGLVCSAQEAEKLSRMFGPQIQLVTPGIRPASAAADDQRRVMTPVKAYMAGSRHLVIGRPVTKASDPLKALKMIQQEIEESFK